MKYFEREWWVTLIPAIVGLLTVIGVIGPNDNALVSAAVGVALIVLPAISYVIMRIWQKVSLEKADASVKIAKAESEAKVAIAESDAKIAAVSETVPCSTEIPKP
jgi:hypothetical protein